MQVCGAPIIVRGGRRVEGGLPGRQGVLLWGYLVLHRRRAVSRHELMDAVWGDAWPEAPDAGLRALLSKTRAALGSHTLTGRSALRLNLPAGTRVDIEDAREATHRAEAAVARGDWASAWGPARVALLIAQRGFLTGVDAPWVDPVRAEVARMERRALHCVAVTGIELGGPELESAERAARRLVETAPMEERGHRCLIQVLTRRGEAAEALAVYEDLRHRLRDALGAEPGPETRALHRELLDMTAG